MRALCRRPWQGESRYQRRVATVLYGLEPAATGHRSLPTVEVGVAAGERPDAARGRVDVLTFNGTRINTLRGDTPRGDGATVSPAVLAAAARAEVAS